MSIIDKIESALIQINDAKFQKLCDSYLYKKGYTGITSEGSVLGKEKTRKGTPDSYIALDNGKFIFIEYTTKTDDLYKKLCADINSCLDEKKTGIKRNKLQSIILCYNSNLKADEQDAITKKHSHKNTNIEFIDLSQLSLDLCHLYPSIARDFLGIAYDTDQILSIDEFIKLQRKNRFATPLDNQFLYRKTEIERVLESLSSNIVTVISGKSGLGKTKLALEVINKIILVSTEYEFYSIINRNLEIYDDLITILHPNKKYIILYDDANKMVGHLKQVLSLIQVNSQLNIKILITVRDYALPDVIRLVEKLHDIEPIKLQPLSSKEIREILINSFQIKNPIYLDKIVKLANNNTRLAVMAAQVCLRTQNIMSLYNVENLFDEYYKSINEDISDIQSPAIIKSIGTISFFTKLPFDNIPLINRISSTVGLTDLQLKECFVHLNEYEIVDLYEKYAAKIGDQILGTYLFYKVFIKEQSVDLYSFIKEFFNDHFTFFRDAIIPCVNNFNHEFVVKQLKPIYDRFLNENQYNYEASIRFLELFWFVDQTSTLKYGLDLVTVLPISDLSNFNLVTIEQHYDGDTTDYLTVLEHFVFSDQYVLALDLIFMILERFPKQFSRIINIFSNSFCYGKDSHLQEYEQQSVLVDKLYEKSNGDTLQILYKAVLLHISNKFLAVNQTASWSESNRAYVIANFRLQLNDNQKKIRETLWKIVFELYQIKDFKEISFSIITKYNHLIGHELPKDFLEFDSKYLLDFLTCTFSPTNIPESIFVKEYIELLERVGISNETTIHTKALFNSEQLQLLDVFLKRPSRKELELEYEEYNKYHHSLIENYVENFTLVDYKLIYNQYVALIKHVGNHEEYIITDSLYIAIGILIKKNYSAGLELLSYILSSGNKAKLRHHGFIQALRNNQHLDIEQLYNIIISNQYHLKNDWVIGFFYTIPTNLIDKDITNKLVSFINTASFDYLDLDFDFLFNYEQYEPTIFCSITKVLFEKTKDSNNILFDFLFNPHTKSSSEFRRIIDYDFELAKNIYFYQEGKKNHSDYSGKIFKQFLKSYPAFIIEYIEYKFSCKKHLSIYDIEIDFRFIWSLDNYREIYNILLNSIVSKYPATIGVYYQNFFKCHSDEKSEATRDNYFHEWINEYSNNIEKLNLVFTIIVELIPQKRKLFIEHLIQKNSSYEVFKNLNMESNHWSANGSFVPIFENRKKFWISLLPLFTQIKYLEHRKMVEDRIEKYNQSIENEKRKDFLNDYLN